VVDTKFNLGSMNKMFTTIAVAQLVEKGEPSYEDKVGKYLGEDWIKPENAEKIAIHHLLTHTSGTGDLFSDHRKARSRGGTEKMGLRFRPGERR
jgi:CubicO group peptidase (beta-lactamase class C family)